MTTTAPIGSGGLLTRDSGFTLLEILVSVAILSVVLAAVYGTFFLAQRAVDGVDESLVKLQEARRALDIIRCELESSYFRKTDPDSLLRIKDRDYYGKSATDLVFTAFSPLRPGLSRISYYVEQRDGRLNLFKKVDFARTAGEQAEGVEIIENVDAFSIEAKYQDYWVRTWDTGINGNTPEEIRISLAFRMKDRTVTLSDRATPLIDKPL